MRSALCRSAEGGNTFDHLRITGTPLINLHGSQRPAHNKFDFGDTEFLSDELMLGMHIVIHGDDREVVLIIWGRGITWRRR
ncbi:hypothetical protein D3C76_1408570 [compost metagenome]